MGHIEPHRMSEQHTVYYSDEEDELADWVEQYEDVLGGRSDMYKRAMILLRKDHGDDIEDMSDENEGRDVLT